MRDNYEKAEPRFTKEKRPKLSMADRILLFLYQTDVDHGRNDKKVVDWYDDLKETLFMFSSNFVHSSEMTFLNIVYWEELREWEPPPNAFEGKVPPNFFEGFAAITNGSKLSYYLALKKLLNNELIYGFVSSMRAINPLGSKKIPALQIFYLKNRDRYKDIVAISLTERGFKEGKKLSKKYTVMMHWQLHKFLMYNKEFAQMYTGRKKMKLVDKIPDN